uniref:Solute-binding protein family 3/N-terminal domain-containing protein n=1 Tax=Trichuris muris TaxID=70415 RepID=A0A5S6R251_TRIMR
MDCFYEYPNGCLDPGPGADAEYIYSIIRDVFQVPVEWVYANNYMEMRQILLNKSADLSGTSWTLEPEAIEGLWYTNVVIFDGIALLFRRDLKDMSSQFHATLLLPLGLWILAFLCFLAVYTTSHLSQYMYRYFSFFKSNSMTIGFVKLLREKMFYTLCFLFLSIFFNLYSNILSVGLVKKHTKFVTNFKSLADLGQLLLEKKCKLVLLASNSQYNVFYRSLIHPEVQPLLPWTAIFRQAYTVNPPLIVETVDELGNLVEDTENCYIGVDFAETESFYESRFCSIDVVPLGSVLQQERFVFLCNSPKLVEYLNVVILSSSFQQLAYVLIRKYDMENLTHVCEEDYRAANIDLNIGKTQDAFFTIAIGWIFGLLCLIFERKVPMRYFYASAEPKPRTKQRKRLMERRITEVRTELAVIDSSEQRS